MGDTEILGNRKEFPPTSWTLVRGSRETEALQTLIVLYWKPLYFFVRRHGYDNETAKDIVQGFLSDLVEGGNLSKADPARGKFRTFLLAALSNYMKDRQKSESRQKRTPGQAVLSLDFRTGEQEYALEPATEETPEKVVDRTWARCLLDHAMTRLQGEPSHLEAFRRYWAGEDYDSITERTGMTPAAARTAIHRLKGQLRDLITATLSATSSGKEELEAELAEFLSLIR